KRFGGSSLDTGDALALHPASGSIYIAGSFRGSVDFGAGALANTNGYSLPFLARYSALDGSYQWAKRFGRMDSALSTRGNALGVAVDRSGNVAIAGFFSGPVDFGGGALAQGGDLDVFVAKFSSSGAHLWSKGFGGALDQ